MPAPARAAESFLGTASYDTRAGRLLLPYAGQFPPYHLRRYIGTTWVALDFIARPGFGLAQARELCSDPDLLRWRLVPQGARRVSLLLLFRQPRTPRVVDDARSQQVVVWLDGSRRASASATSGPRHQAPAPGVPVALPTPTPSWPTPAWPSTVPASASRPSSSPLPSPSASPPPSPSAGPPAGPTFVLGTRYFLANYREAYPAGDVALQTNAIQVPGLEAAVLGIVGDRANRAAIAVDSVSYSFRDKNLPLSSHARQELHAEASLLRRFGSDMLHVETGIGYLLRWESALHTGAPPQPSYAFSASRVFQGPELVGSFGWTWGDDWPSYLRGWQVRANGAIAPLIGSQIDAGIPALPALASGRFELGVEHALGAARLGLAYRRWWTGSFGGYDEVFEGPVLTLSSF